MKGLDTRLHAPLHREISEWLQHRLDAIRETAPRRQWPSLIQDAHEMASKARASLSDGRARHR